MAFTTIAEASMKFFGKIVLVGLLVLARSSEVRAQVATVECLTSWCIDDQYDSTHYGICHNPDSVKVDTCSGSLTHGELYGKKWFNVRFDPYAISLPSAPYDTVLEVRWTSIDTSYTSLRTSFSVLESKFGTLWLRKGSPDLTDPADSSSHVYQMRFENYVCIDSVVNDLENIAGLVRPYFLSNPGILLSIPTQVDTHFNNFLLIYPNPASNSFTLRRRDGLAMKEIILYSQSGQKVLTCTPNATELQVSITHLANGNYYVNCDQNVKKINIIK
ncbi:MAG: T9SS type A sorting domain-containing protein [bacterium]